MDREERGGEEEPEEQGMRHYGYGSKFDVPGCRAAPLSNPSHDKPTYTSTTMIWPLLALSLIPLCLAANNSPHDELVQLAAAGNGVIRLDERVFDLLTSPKRTWSASIQFTALNPQRRCAPCK